jgi:hypothetical protein
MPSLTRKIPHGSDVERFILQELRRKVKLWESGTVSKRAKWRDAEERVLAFLPEREVDSIRRTSREGGLPQYTTIQIPYSFAVVMASHTYLSSVFMGRNPVFQYDGLHGETQQQTQAVEALVAYQVTVGEMIKYLYTWLYDALKYGEGMIGLFWDERINVISNIIEQPQIDEYSGLPTGQKMERLQLSQPVRSYAGNRIYNVEPQSFIWDTRFPLREFQRGEFCGELRRVPWNEIIRRKKLGYYMNTECLPPARSGYEYTTAAEEGSSQLERPETFSQIPSEASSSESEHPVLVELYQLAVEIIPNEWRLSESDFPEKWVFTFSSDYRTLIGAQPLGALHCRFPYSNIPLEPEGYGLTTRGLPEILEPVQNTVDWLINTHFYNVRASLNDRWVVDPSRVVLKDALDPLPGKLIRLRPEAYGSDPRTAIAQFPASNVTQGHVATDFPMMFGLGERISGVSDQIMGMLESGGRKTATEVRTSTSFGINRLKTQAEFASACGWDPLSLMLVANSQQYFDMDLKLRIAGDLVNDAGPGFIQVNPDIIAGNFSFVPVDGTLPIDRNAQFQQWMQMLQILGSAPQLGMGYDLGGIFSWMAKLGGLKNISQFKVQITPDQILQQQMQAGNSVPMQQQQQAKRPNGSAPGAQSYPGYSGSATPGH